MTFWTNLFCWIPIQRKGDTDNWNSKPECPQSKAHTKAQAGNVILAIQQGGDSHEEVEDYGNLVEGHKEKEEAAHPLIEVVVEAQAPFGP